MKTTSKRSTRADSTAGKKKAMKAAASGVIKPPKHVRLRDGDLPFWESIIRARARDTWTDVDLVKAANLARTQADIERLSADIEEEGDVIENKRGTPIANPKHTLLETLSRREIALSRVLHVHAEATVGKSEDAAKKLQAQKQAEQSVETVRNSGLDDLIPGIATVQ